MKAKTHKARNQATSGWATADVKASLAARAYYREWMERIWLTDVAEELGALEQMFRYRAELTTDLVNPLAPHPDDARWEGVARRERALAQRFANLREKIAWVLQP